MKKKLQSLHWGRKRRAEEADDEGEAGGDQQTHLSSFTHNQRYGGDDERQCLLSTGLISDHDLVFDWLIDWWIDWLIDWLFDYWLIDVWLIDVIDVWCIDRLVYDWLCFVLQKFPVSMERWVICWCLWSLCFWSKVTSVLMLNVLPESRSHHSRIHRRLLELWFMCHDTWATCPSESGRRCRTSSTTVRLQKIGSLTH